MLASGDSVKSSYPWDTTNYALANYTTSATAAVVAGGTHTADSTLNGGRFAVTTHGDVDGDFGVEIVDMVEIT